MSVAGMVRVENVRRVQLVSSLLADILTAGGQHVLAEMPQFDLIIDLLFQVVTRYSCACVACVDVAMSIVNQRQQQRIKYCLVGYFSSDLRRPRGHPLTSS